ncbi:MAG TPA: dihydrodipicolinate synthase family protein [Vicinamibacterales bacterium]
MFSGVIPILATPFHDDERLDLESWQRLIEFMVRIEVNGITILGVLGESNRLTDRERETLIGAAVSAVDGRMPVIVGSSHTGTQAAGELARMAQDLGADAVMVAPSKEPVPSDDRILEYYQRIADGLSIPIVLQDHPASTEVHLSAKLILSLLHQVPAISCVKEEAVPTAAKIRQLRDGLGETPFPILTGLGALYAPFDLKAGSNGFNTGFAFPEVLQAMVEAASNSDWPLVYRIYRRFAALIVFEQQPGVAVRKELLRRRGLLATARVRHPGATISPSASHQLDAVLDATLAGTDLTQPLTVEYISEPA